jgi:penicillin amidase
VTADLTQRPFEFHAIGNKLGLEGPLLPRDWTPEDVLAWQAMLLRRFDPGALNQGQLDNAALLQYLSTVFGEAEGFARFNDLRWGNDPDAQTYIPAESMAAAADAERKRMAPAGGGKPQAAAAAAWTLPDSDLQKAAQRIRERMERQEKSLKKINAWVEMGSYAWVVSGDKTDSGRPILYSGPQMGFSVPAIVQEGSIEAAGLEISGMTVPGMPGIIIGRTPHHTWSMQVGHAHTTDYYFESPAAASLHRMETIEVAGGEDVALPVYRTGHGPVISPLPFNPSAYDPAADGPVISWRYAHWGEEFENLSAFLDLARARSMDEFGAALRDVAVSQHYCYADAEGNIAYWMTGMDPVRPAGFDYRLPQGLTGAPQAEWDDDVLKPLSADRNTVQGFYCGWNNKSSPDYPNSYNNMSYFFGPFHRAHVIEAYLESHDELTFEQIRDLALNIAATDSIRSGGNPWAFVESAFRDAVSSSPTDARTEALSVMEGFDGHFVAGGEENWVDGRDRSDAWILSDAWIREMINLTFLDELSGASAVYDSDSGEWENPTILFNVILHGLDPETAISNTYNWFDDISTPGRVETAQELIVAALDNVLEMLGEQPWGTGQRGVIEFNHDLFGQEPLALNPLHTMPFASRSTYAHCVEMGSSGPERIESMFPLGESGNILPGLGGTPAFDQHFFSMTEVYDSFAHRDFPGFDAGDGDDTCFIRVLGLQ